VPESSASQSLLLNTSMSELFVCDPMMPDCHCTKHLGRMEGCLANALGCGDGDLKGSAQTRRQRDHNPRTSPLHITSPYCTGLELNLSLLEAYFKMTSPTAYTYLYDSTGYAPYLAIDA
jgi:hypothetical protein